MNDTTSIKNDIDDIFAHFTPKTDDLEGRVEVISEKADQLQTIVETREIRTLEDKAYLIENCKKVIDIGTRVLASLEQGMKTGVAGAAIEAFAILITSITTSIEKMTVLNAKLFDIQEMQNVVQPEKSSTTNNNLIVMDGKQMAEYLKDITEKAKKISPLREIIVEPEKPEEK